MNQDSLTSTTLNSSMDKKNQLIPKSCSSQTDASKSRQDGACGGGSQSLPTRNKSQYRKQSNPSNARSETYTRKASQKINPMDKRPRPRGFNNSEQVVVNETKPEMGSLQSPGSKKQNFDHLLNFHFAPRDNRGHENNLEPRSSTYSRNKNQTRPRPKHIKESFIHSNCQFMVKAEKDVGDYLAYQYEPDLLVDWKSIEQILIRTYGGNPICPICLSPPSAAKMTRCGHIFCWPCLLQYLSYEDEKYRPCPICFEPISRQDLKSVVSNLLEEFKVGETIDMELICRPKDSSDIAMPVACKNGVEINSNWERRFKKLLLVDPDQVQNVIIQREHDELMLRFCEDMESLESQFVTDAMNQLEIRKNQLIEAKNASQTQIPNIPIDISPTSSTTSTTLNEESNDDILLPPSIEKGEENKSVKEEDSWASYYYYYQASDGRNCYLTPLNMAMLNKSLGPNPTTWPQSLSLKVLELEGVSMSHDMRKRLRFLAHLPLHTPFQLVEMELKSPLVSEEVLSEFRGQLGMRQRRRSEKIRGERRRERLHAQAMERAIPRYPKMESRSDFPLYGHEDEENRVLERVLQASLDDFKSTDSIGDEGETRSETSEINEINELTLNNMPLLSSSPSMSFAQALSLCPPRENVLKRSPTYPVGGGTSKSSLNESVGDGDEFQSVPNYRASVSDAINKAFASLNLSPRESTSEEVTRQKKKGKKSRGKVLFATGMEMGTSNNNN